MILEKKISNFPVLIQKVKFLKAYGLFTSSISKCTSGYYWIIENNSSYGVEINLHNPDGPAVVFDNGEKEYWLQGQKYDDIRSDDEWKSYLSLNIFK